jgi:predicted RNA-binding protein YlxR (DUF448 family)
LLPAAFAFYDATTTEKYLKSKQNIENLAESQGVNLRLCASCRVMKNRRELIRLTVDHRDGTVVLNESPSGTQVAFGRSVYLCGKRGCIERAVKSHKLKAALEGGRGRKERPRRQVKWPLESSLIHTLTSRCTES